jgi:hypothetical protein
VSGPHDSDRCPACGASGDELHSSNCRWVGNPNRKWSDEEIDPLAKQMWQAYVKAQVPNDRQDYRRWDELTDVSTLRGVRAVARLVIKMGLRPRSWQRPGDS